MSETQTLHFSIEGEWLDQFVKDLWTEKPKLAYEQALDCCQGDKKNALDWLEGRLKTVGWDSDMQIVPCDVPNVTAVDLIQLFQKRAIDQDESNTAYRTLAREEPEEAEYYDEMCDTGFERYLTLCDNLKFLCDLVGKPFNRPKGRTIAEMRLDARHEDFTRDYVYGREQYHEMDAGLLTRDGRFIGDTNSFTFIHQHLLYLLQEVEPNVRHGSDYYTNGMVIVRNKKFTLPNRGHHAEGDEYLTKAQIVALIDYATTMGLDVLPGDVYFDDRITVENLMAVLAGEKPNTMYSFID
jgi:hypothetical protein